MRKIAIAVLAILACSISARAQQLTNAQAVKSVVPYVTDCSTASIGTTAVEVTGNTSVVNTTYGASSVKITNQGATNNVCCSHASNVTCNTGDVVAASAAAPFNWLSWAVSTSQKWFCVTAASTTQVLICRVK